MDAFIEFLIERQWEILFMIIITGLAIVSNLVDFAIKEAKVASILLVVFQSLLAIFLSSNQESKISEAQASVSDYKYALSLCKSENVQLKSEVIKALDELGIQSEKIKAITTSTNQEIEDAEMAENFSTIKSSLGQAKSTLSKVYSLNLNQRWEDVLAILSADLEVRSSVHQDIISMYADFQLTEDRDLQMEILDLIMWVNVYKVNDSEAVQSLVRENLANVKQRVKLLESKKKKQEETLRFIGVLASRVG